LASTFTTGVAIDTSLSYCHFALNDTSLVSSGFVDFCTARDIALINASPISMGLLMERDPPSWHPATPATKALCKQAVALCREEGVDLAKLALHFCLREERVATTLISSTSLARMHPLMSNPLFYGETKAAQASPSWPSGRLSLALSQRQITPQAAPSSGQLRPTSRLGPAGRAGRHYRPCSSTQALESGCSPAESERQRGSHPR
jgi:hypothetical protein